LDAPVLELDPLSEQPYKEIPLKASPTWYYNATTVNKPRTDTDSNTCSSTPLPPDVNLRQGTPNKHAMKHVSELMTDLMTENVGIDFKDDLLDNTLNSANTPGSDGLPTEIGEPPEFQINVLSLLAKFRHIFRKTVGTDEAKVIPYLMEVDTQSWAKSTKIKDLLIVGREEHEGTGIAIQEPLE
jgi:hypothetical protein